MNPSEDDVRAGIAWIKSLTLLHEDTVIRPAAMSYVKPSEYRRWVELRLDDVLALLDAGRKDRERVDWLEHQSEYGRVALDTNNPEFDNSEPKYTVYASAKGGRKFGDTLRAAIDQARGA